eukprot:gene20650-26773_t
MGATASISVTIDEINNLPQYHLLGGDQKFEELKEDDVPTSPKASTSQKATPSASPAPKPLAVGAINASKPINTGKGYQSMKGGKIKINIDELKFPGDEH